MIKTNLAVLMAERGLKIADVYEATGISKTTLMAISENVGRGIQYKTIDKLCNFFQVTPADFFIYAPFISNIENAQYEASEHSWNFIYSIKNGELETIYDMWIDFLSGNYAYMDEELNNSKNTTSFDFVFSFHFSDEDDRNTFYQFYNSLPIQFRDSIKDEIFNYVIDYINGHDKVKYFESTNDYHTVFLKFADKLKEKEKISILFVLVSKGGNIYSSHTLKVKKQKIIYR